MGFSWQGYWSLLPCPSPGDLSNPGIEPRSPALQADTLPSEPQESSVSHPKWLSPHINLPEVTFLVIIPLEKKQYYFQTLNKYYFSILKYVKLLDDSTLFSEKNACSEAMAVVMVSGERWWCNFIFKYLFIYLAFLGLSCGMQTLSCIISGSLTRDWTQDPPHYEHGILATGPPGKSLVV